MFITVVDATFAVVKSKLVKFRLVQDRGGGGVLPYMGYISTCRCEGYGFQAVYCRIGYINQSVWV